ncbi:3,4-dihydroxy-2-butanone 4-phosphate synthase [Methanosalsum zhilinae DSM 4017]|uniref:3,4-dihydroxy-2-butanone 4-phosphate synthase n=1 Tax=Methanosalsum zhilinae (strain DSM 4017 / NBRC 107636 / OCM 62 / WeN5) TaxID=679901 RepID=F7XKT6_METZD|nr:3,4-dihydroxy-2-butanone-4-phosphate synthase [Methanosalsum zhilinae]AEH61799.1 3,4-dihydroxy-2-butanone 4-phosphate synthase [Methanosalsum zhilinae DSM 4017]
MNYDSFSENVKRALESLRQGKMILLFDMEGREEETDFAIPALSVNPSDVRVMRKDGGGLICVSVGPDASEKLGLVFMADMLRDAATVNPALAGIIEKSGDIEYDSRSSFSLWVNHRNTRTGIPDNDRALTISRIGEIVRDVMEGIDVKFGSEFRTPGHVALLRAAEDLLDDRCGQTELSVALTKMAGITPAMAICEMLDDHNGLALSKEDAIRYAEDNGLVFVEGKEILEAYRTWNRMQS